MIWHFFANINQWFFLLQAVRKDFQCSKRGTIFFKHPSSWRNGKMNIKIKKCETLKAVSILTNFTTLSLRFLSLLRHMAVKIDQNQRFNRSSFFVNMAVLWNQSQYQWFFIIFLIFWDCWWNGFCLKCLDCWQIVNNQLLLVLNEQCLQEPSCQWQRLQSTICVKPCLHYLPIA